MGDKENIQVEHQREEEGKASKRRRDKKRSPLYPSSSPSSSESESTDKLKRRGHRRSYAAWKRSKKLKKFKEGGKNVTFLPMMELLEKRIRY